MTNYSTTFTPAEKLRTWGMLPKSTPGVRLDSPFALISGSYPEYLVIVNKLPPLTKSLAEVKTLFFEILNEYDRVAVRSRMKEASSTMKSENR